MQKHRSLITLLLSAVLHLTALHAQTGVKVVPDSLTCITPTDANVFIGMAYDLNQARTSLVLRDSTIKGLQIANNELRSESDTKDERLDIASLKNNICLKDNEYITGLLHVANKKAKIGRIGFKIVLGVAVLEGLYIGYKAVTK